MFPVGYVLYNVAEINGPPVPCVQKNAQMLTDQHKKQVSFYTSLLVIAHTRRLLPQSLVCLLVAENHDVIVVTPVAMRPLVRDLVIFEAWQLRHLAGRVLPAALNDVVGKEEFPCLALRRL